MKYNRHQLVYYGSKRVVRKFLWLPLQLPIEDTDTIEIRWLEMALIRQTYIYGRETLIHDYWKDQCWVDTAFPLAKGEPPTLEDE